MGGVARERADERGDVVRPMAQRRVGLDAFDEAVRVCGLRPRGRVDPARLAIRGASAGGYTTLAALARDDTPFAAGADHFGVADLEALAAETHKFESRYLDGLIGPYPQRRDVYIERSPIHHVEKLTRPLIVLQGMQDEVVPPNQSEMIVNALRARKVPVAYLLFDGPCRSPCPPAAATPPPPPTRSSARSPRCPRRPVGKPVKLGEHPDWEYGAFATNTPSGQVQLRVDQRE